MNKALLRHELGKVTQFEKKNVGHEGDPKEVTFN